MSPTQHTNKKPEPPKDNPLAPLVRLLALQAARERHTASPSLTAGNTGSSHQKDRHTSSRPEGEHHDQ